MKEPRKPSFSTPDRYQVGQRVLFTNRVQLRWPGVIQAVTPGQEMAGDVYNVGYRVIDPTQRALPLDRQHPEERFLFFKARDLILIEDEELTRNEFLALTPTEVHKRYFS